MPPTIRIRKGDSSTIQYQIMDFDETTSSLLPVDLDGKTVYYTSYIEATGYFPTVEDVCEILNDADGWVSHDIDTTETATVNMMEIYFDVEDADGKRARYPRYEKQFVYIME